MPDAPWKKLAMDFKGPVGNQYYFFLVIDEYSGFPEVEIVTSTSAKSVLPKLDLILCTHGIPESIKSDNGPPFNSHEMEVYTAKRGFYHQRIEPEQPSSNGLAENFMRMLLKLSHTAIIDREDPREAVQRYLLSYRATPHSSTGFSPAELLYNRKINTTIPVIGKTVHPSSRIQRFCS